MGHEPYIREVPGGTQAVLMIHGIVGTPRHFDCLLPYIPEHWSVHNILLHGHGGTVRDFSRSSMEKWKAQLHAELSDLCSRYEQVVVIAHSMGTLLTIEAAPSFPQVKALLLLNVPLCPRIHPSLVPRTLKLCFGKIDRSNPWELALEQASGVQVTWKLWQYLGFIPRYVELLLLCRQTRKRISGISLPCHAYFSVHDELVSIRSRQYFLGHPVVRHHVLEHSGHFSYAPEDLTAIAKAIKEFFS